MEKADGSIGCEACKCTARFLSHHAAGALVVLLEDLGQARVVDAAVVEEQHHLAVEVDHLPPLACDCQQSKTWIGTCIIAGTCNGPCRAEGYDNGRCKLINECICCRDSRTSKKISFSSFVIA